MYVKRETEDIFKIYSFILYSIKPFIIYILTILYNNRIKLEGFCLFYFLMKFYHNDS